MHKTKDVVLIELYDKAEVDIVTAWLNAKMRRVTDRQRKQDENRNHQRKLAQKRMETFVGVFE